MTISDKNSPDGQGSYGKSIPKLNLPDPLSGNSIP